MSLSKDYFSLFGLSPSFSFDEDALRRRYRELQQAVHPDRYAGASDQERRYSVQLAARLNEAYRTLRDPVARARYLIELQGGDPETGGSGPAPALLEEQMALRERLAEIRAARDLQALDRFRSALAERFAGTCEAFAVVFADGDVRGLDEARALYHELQFLARLREEAGALEDALQRGGGED